MADLNQIAESLSSLTVMQAAELVKMLEEKWGVSAAAPVAAAAAPAAGGGAAAAKQAEETGFPAKETGSGAGSPRSPPVPEFPLREYRVGLRGLRFSGVLLERKGANADMAATVQNNFRIRKNFAKIQKIIDIPNLIDIQKHSYDKFLQADKSAEQREDTGLQGVFKSVFPIKDFNETSSLEFVSYHLETPKYDVDECHQRGMTFSAPIKVVVRLVVWAKDEAP